jgi:hypothetical protein
MPKKASTKTETKTNDVKVVEAPSTIVSIHGHDYDLSNRDDKNSLIDRTSLTKKAGRDTVNLLSKLYLDKKLKDRLKADIVKHLTKYTLTDDKYDEKVKKAEAKKASYTPSSYFIFQAEKKTTDSSLKAKDVKQLWDGLSDDERKVYTDKAAELKAAKLAELSSGKSSKKASKKAKEPKPPSAPKKKNGGRVSKTKKAKAKK